MPSPLETQAQSQHSIRAHFLQSGWLSRSISITHAEHLRFSLSVKFSNMRHPQIDATQQQRQQLSHSSAKTSP
ncbi:hypothetical protein PoB_000370500 [Plakobranchus ocellatus]|uniref:Uncharacterized protein n=1 Tax=Plakobranchus ocellatus TaxID=259542 RepID=A0AAV3Y3F2_9GAST|nr:hypothetical protein PoB_000370500 [Plakobranchus ocellatus]